MNSLQNATGRERRAEVIFSTFRVTAGKTERGGIVTLWN
jgi:hypothetical protein